MIRLTKKEAILVAAHKFGGDFTIPELVVATWEQNKPLFGLRGFEEVHPDSKDVEAIIYSRGFQGMIKRIGKTEWYCLTVDGNKAAREIIGKKGL